jgi:hypothetical protein
MPRPAGYSKFPLIVAAPVDLALFDKLEAWAKRRQVSKAQVLRDLITDCLPDVNPPQSTTTEDPR